MLFTHYLTLSGFLGDIWSRIDEPCTLVYFMFEDQLKCFTCAGNGERRLIYRVLVGVPEGDRAFGRSRHRWKDIFKMDFHEVE
jgi:hypothetical protein